MKIEIGPVGWACIFGLGCVYPNLYKSLLAIAVVFGLILGGIVISVTAEEFKDDDYDQYKNAWLWDQVDNRYVPMEVARKYYRRDKGYRKIEFSRRFYKPGSYSSAYTSLKYKWELTDKQKGFYFKPKNSSVETKKVEREVEFSVLVERGKKIWKERKKEIAREKELKKEEEL